MLRENRVDIKLAYVGGDIEQEGKPAYPIKELDFADFADLRWQTLDRFEDIGKKGKKPSVGASWRAI